MPTKNPRINVVIERSLYSLVHEIAKKQGVSMSTVIRDLVKEGLELHEDIALAQLAESREKTFDKSKALKHKEVWG